MIPTKTLIVLCLATLALPPPAYALGAETPAFSTIEVLRYEPALLAEVTRLETDATVIVYLELDWTAELLGGPEAPHVVLRNAHGGIVGDVPFDPDYTYELNVGEGLRAVTTTTVVPEEALLPSASPNVYALSKCTSDHINCVNTNMDEGCYQCIRHYATGVAGASSSHFMWGCDNYDGCLQLASWPSGFGPYTSGWICMEHRASIWGSSTWTELRTNSWTLVGNSISFWYNRDCDG